MSSEGWNYFVNDPRYSDLLKERLLTGVTMDSAIALADYLNELFTGPLRVVDIGSGPGHYFPVLRQRYTRGHLHYTGIDIDASNVDYGNRHFAGATDCRIRLGSVLEPGDWFDEADCVISANTLPHVPTIQPLLERLAAPGRPRYILFRMLIGEECVQIKKHLRADDFEDLFDRNFQFNNIYSLAYLRRYLGPQWALSVHSDKFDIERLQQHSVPAQQDDPFYSNRVSRAVGSLVFKGDVFMPWKFVAGIRCA